MNTLKNKNSFNHRLIELSHQHIAEAVEIHTHFLGYSLNALFGRKQLADLYMAILKSDSAAGFVAIDEFGRVIGVVTGVFDHSTMQKKILSFSMILRMALRFIIHPKTWIWMGASIFRRSPKKPCEYSAALTSIAVMSEFRGTGVGRNLVCALERTFASGGIDGYWLETRRANKEAHDFYRKLGFVEYSKGSQDLCLVRKIPGIT